MVSTMSVVMNDLMRFDHAVKRRYLPVRKVARRVCFLRNPQWDLERADDRFNSVDSMG